MKPQLRHSFAETNHPDEVDLLAMSDGEASTEVLAHVAACPDCVQRVAELSKLQWELRRRLYRLFCPTSEQLAAYLVGELASDQSARIAHHLAVCPLCTGEAALVDFSPNEGRNQWGGMSFRCSLPVFPKI